MKSTQTYIYKPSSAARFVAAECHSFPRFPCDTIPISSMPNPWIALFLKIHHCHQHAPTSQNGLTSYEDAQQRSCGSGRSCILKMLNTVSETEQPTEWSSNVPCPMDKTSSVCQWCGRVFCGRPNVKPAVE